MRATETDTAMMRRALELAGEAGAMGEVPIGAVVYRHADDPKLSRKVGETRAGAVGEVLGEGFNRRETDADPAAHAELLAIRAACARIGDWRLTGCTLVVTLEPCPMCAGAIVNARVDRVAFGASDPKAGAGGTLLNLLEEPRLNHRVGEVVSGVLEESCAAVLRGFFMGLRGGS